MIGKEQVSALFGNNQNEEVNVVWEDMKVCGPAPGAEAYDRKKVLQEIKHGHGACVSRGFPAVRTSTATSSGVVYDKVHLKGTYMASLVPDIPEDEAINGVSRPMDDYAKMAMDVEHRLSIRNSLFKDQRIQKIMHTLAHIPKQRPAKYADHSYMSALYDGQLIKLRVNPEHGFLTVESPPLFYPMPYLVDAHMNKMRAGLCFAYAAFRYLTLTVAQQRDDIGICIVKTYHD
mmetsp:Transcript_24763/g.40162  ORF Transcript_24763/g.40162 Transcript_24763/m.40162 type:complete len:232 (-) Transcript_24763:150-845(-)